MTQQKEIWAYGHELRMCGPTTGHFVRAVAFCESNERATAIADACNSHATLVERVAKLEEVIADLCRAIEDYAPEDNVALNQAWFLAVEAAKP